MERIDPFCLGSQPAKTRDRGVTALMVAAWSGNVDMIRLLCEAGANVNQMEYHARCPLHVAAQQGHVAAAQLLIELGADVNGGWQGTPLMHAVDTRRTLKTPQQVKTLVELLLSHGANPSITANRESPEQLIRESGFPQQDQDALIALLARASKREV